MLHCNRMPAAILAAAVLLSCTTARAQWSQRWNTSGIGDDIGQVTAVDRHGNVYVAGASKNWHSHFDFGIVKYDSSGVFQWAQPYDGPAGGDDIPTSIHVDYDGYVTVAGTSDGGASGYDFTVIKYDPLGNPVWTGVSGSGLTFHNGAARTTSTDHEGFFPTSLEPHVVMTVRDDWDPANRIIAISGKRRSQMSFSGNWRTLVIEPDPLTPGSVRLKSGWPVDYAGFGNDPEGEVPRDIAIHRDNTVYVCGDTHDLTDPSTFYFTAIRFKAGGHGGGNPPDAVIWQYYHAPFQKSNSARGIVLDRDGHAYVTGTVTTQPTDVNYDYYTVRLNREPNLPTFNAPPDSNADVDWGVQYDAGLTPGADDQAFDIDLTYEVETSGLTVYAHVTGFSYGTQQGGSSSGKDIATVRYVGANGTQVNVRRYDGPNHREDFGRKVIGAGRNTYVIGHASLQAGSDPASFDYVLLGYRKGSSPSDLRFTPVTYDNGGEDQGRGGTMVGAGVIVATGYSQGGTSNFDFATLLYPQSFQAASPASYSVLRGSYIAGAVGDLLAAGEDPLQYMEFLYGNDGNRGPNVHVEFPFTPQHSDASEMTIRVRLRTNVAGVDQKVEIYDAVAGQWELVDWRDSTSTYTTLVLVLKDDPKKYINGSGQVQVRLLWEEPTSTFPKWRAYVDQLVIETIGD